MNKIIFLNKFSPTFYTLKYIHMKYTYAHICMYVVYTHIDVTGKLQSNLGWVKETRSFSNLLVF